MSRLTIYGVTGSRAFRAIWMAQELGLDYEQVPVRFDNGETRSPDFLKINPNGHIPAIRDGDLTLWESMAINLYLARKHGKGLWPATVEDEGRAFMWSFWAITEVEPRVLRAAMHRTWLPEAKRDESVAAAAERELQGPLTLLDSALDGRDYLLGGGFTVADLNLADPVSWCRLAKIDLGPYPRAAAWLRRCLDRPAARAARKG
jgi:glutathione S-transferase